MKHIIATFATLFVLCNLSAQEIVTIDTSQYLVTYTPLPKAIEATQRAIASVDKQIEKTQQEIEKQVAQLKTLQTRKIELETALKLMQNPAPSKAVAPSPAPPDATPEKPKKQKKTGKKPVKKE